MSKANELLSDLVAFAESKRIRPLRCAICSLEPEQRAAIKFGLEKDIAANMIARWWAEKFPEIRITRSMIENHVRGKHEALREKSE